MLQQYETLQFEGNILTYLPGKCFKVYKIIANNIKKTLIVESLFYSDKVWAPVPYTASHFVQEQPRPIKKTVSYPLKNFS